MRISFVEKETTMTTDKNNSCYPGATAPGFKIAARFARRERRCCFYKLFRLFPKELIGKPAARAAHGNVNEDNFDGSRQANGNRSRFRRGGIG